MAGIRLEGNNSFRGLAVLPTVCAQPKALYIDDAMLPALPVDSSRHVMEDWLIAPSSYRSSAQISDHEILLSNGIVSRTWYRNGDAVGCYSINCHSTNQEFLRSIRPEVELTINGKVYPVGGLTGQKAENFILPQWLETLQPFPNGFRLTSVAAEAISPRFPSRLHHEWMGHPAAWPPTGRQLVMTYAGPKGTDAEGMEVDVHTELYDGLPLFGKWFEL